MTVANQQAPTVILAEDEQTLRALLSKQLRYLGYQVLEAGDGLEALSVFEQNSEVDLLITDIMMPSMGGIELAERVRKKNPDLPIIFISGYLNDTNLDFTKIRGRTLSLRKPFTLRVLADKVEEILGE